MRALRTAVAKRLSISLSKTSSSKSQVDRIIVNNSSTYYCNTITSQNSSLCGWLFVQSRGFKVQGSNLRTGNVIEKKGHLYEVVKAEHKPQGRGGALIQAELRDIDSGNKVNLRLGTDEAIERVFVEEKSYTYLYTDQDNVVLMEPETFDQIEVPKSLFGKAAAYLTDQMKVSVKLFDGRPLSASVPTRVTCIVKEAQTSMKGITATPQYKRVLLDNGLTVYVPSHVEAGEAVIINTETDSYLSRA